MNTKLFTRLCRALLPVCALALVDVTFSAAPNAVVTYHGRIGSHGTNFSGIGQFKFALVTASNNTQTATATANLSGSFVTSYTIISGGSGYTVPPAVTITGGGGAGATATANVAGGIVTSLTPGSAGSGYLTPPTVTIAPPPASVVFTTFWSNDGTSTAGGEPGAAVSVNVSNGLFSVGLGDATLPNMAAINSSLFLQQDLLLRIWFNDGASGFAVLNPPQGLTHTPYAAHAAHANVASNLSGTISSANIGAGSITTTMLAAGAVGANQLASGAVTTMALADGAVTANKISTASNWFTLTIANPMPAANDNFGSPVTVLGIDRLLIGAYQDDIAAANAGAAYLFNINGDLLATFTSPTPAATDWFGYSMAAPGNDRVLIGAPYDETGASDAGAAYLFSTNGAFLGKFNNPAPAISDRFGFSVAALDYDRVLIAAPFDDRGASDAGTVYLFNTNGSLLTTLTNPIPTISGLFGYSIASVGSDRILIAAPYDDSSGNDSGIAYLFGTNGSLLTTFTNPSPAALDRFGFSVVAVGSDRVLISAPFDDTGTNDAGTVYLFSTNGTLLTTLTNPTPGPVDWFGYSIAAAGGDRLLIGAPYDDTDVIDGGRVYLFSTAGALLNTFQKSIPRQSDFFGLSVAAMGSDRVLAGATGDDAGAIHTGAAYLFKTETYTPGLMAERVNSGSINTDSLADGAVTVGKLDSSIGVWTAVGGSVFREFGSVGIGVTTPEQQLSVGGGLNIDQNNANLGTRAFALQFGSSSGEAIGSKRTAGGNQFGLDFYTSTQNRMSILNNGNVGIGYSSPGATLEVRTTSATGNAIRFGFASGGVGNLIAGPSRVSIATGDLIERLSISQANGNVGIGTTSPGYTLEVNGSAGKPGGGSWSAASDQRLKKNIRPLAGALDKLLALHGVNFEYIDPAKIHELSGERMGLLAQEVEKVFPDWVETAADGYKRVTVRGLEALVVEALRELQQRQQANDAMLADELKRRRAENAALAARLEKLERSLETRFNSEP